MEWFWILLIIAIPTIFIPLIILVVYLDRYNKRKQKKIEEEEEYKLKELELKAREAEAISQQQASQQPFEPSKKDIENYRIYNAEYYLINGEGEEIQIIPKQGIMSSKSLIVIESKIDKKVYVFVGKNVNNKQTFQAKRKTSALRLKLGYKIVEISFPEEVTTDSLQFYEFLSKSRDKKEIQDIKTKYYTCYYCGDPIDQTTQNCSSCKKEILKCNVCKLPISFGDEVGKCSLCEKHGHLVHLQEWVKTQGKCPNCLQDIPLEAIITEVISQK